MRKTRATDAPQGVETLADVLRATSMRWGDRPALSMRSGLREDSWSYCRLQRAAEAVASNLRNDLHLRPGDRVVVWAPNSPQLAAVYFATFMARLILVPVDPYATLGVIRRIVDRTEPAAIIAATELPEDLGVPIIRMAELPFHATCAPLPDRPAPEDIAEIVFTSGTTGDPKGVILTHANIIANVQAAKTVLPPHPHYRLLSILPLSHMLEQTAGLYVPMLFGATIFYPSNRQPPTLLGILKRHRIVTMVVVPQALTLLLNGIEREISQRGQTRRWRSLLRIAGTLPIPLRRVVFHSVHRQLGGRLAFVICGGAHLPTSVIETWERLGIPILEGYGTTECAPIISTNSLATARSRSLGPPLPGVEVRIGDEDEIQVRGACVTPGYWHDDHATEAAFTDGGWYRTGDIGQLDSHGHLHVCARLKDMIVLPSGLNVFPEDVEREILLESAIADCVVIGMADDEGNQHVHAVVISAMDPGADQRVIHDAVQRANSRLAPHQRVTGVSFWEYGDFPRTNLQKVKRHDVLAAIRGAPLPAAQSVTLSEAHIDQLQGLLARVANVAPQRIAATSDLALDLNLDSLSRVELAVTLESELGVSIEDGDLAVVGTVSELVELLEHGQSAPPTVLIPRWARSLQARSARWLIQRAFVFPLHRLICRPFRVTGIEHVAGLPGTVLLIANHSSHLDTPSILRALPPAVRRQTAVAAAADYFYRSRMFGTMMSLLLNTFPFSREGAVRGSLEYCGELADNGWSILIYPEGTRSPDGTLQPFRGGIGLLAAELRLPVVPIAVTGSHDILPKGTHFPRRGPVTVRFGCPIMVAPDDDREATAFRLHDAMRRLQESGQVDLATVKRDTST